MNRTLSRTILVLLVFVASGIVTGGAAQAPAASPPPGAPLSGADLSQVMDLPAQCLIERNHGACMDCCKEATGAPASVCSRFCKIYVPPPPEPEPQP